MAKLKAVDKDEILDEKIVEVNPHDEDEVYDLLAGYRDSDGVIHKQFTLREMTGKDEEAVHKSNIKSNGSRVASTLLSRCVTSIGSLTPKSEGKQKWDEIIKNLYTGDQDYMLLQLRKLSIGDEIEVNHVCPNKECRAKLNTVLEIDELEIVPFMGDRDIAFELPRGYKDKKGEIHYAGTMRLPSGMDREILTQIGRASCRERV